MTDKINRFTKRTQQVLSRAVEEARLLNHDYVGTEHLLLGLVKEDDAITADVLRSVDVSPAHVLLELPWSAVGQGVFGRQQVSHSRKLD